MIEAEKSFDEIWISNHGASRSVGGDPEWHKLYFKSHLRTYSIKWEPRPARRHSLVLIVQLKNRVMKSVMQRISIENPFMDLDLLIAREIFLNNVTSGLRTALSFEMSRGYVPRIVGLLQNKADSSIVHTHRTSTSKRAFIRWFQQCVS